MLDIDGLENAFRNVSTPNPDILMSYGGDFLAALTDYQTGKSVFVDVKKVDDPFAVLVASCSFPILSGNKKVLINGREYVDGGLASPGAIQYAIESLGATDILVLLTGSPFAKKRPNLILNEIYKRNLLPKTPRGLQHSLSLFAEKCEREDSYVRGERALPPGVKLAYVYPSIMPISEFCMDRDLLIKGANTAYKFTNDLIQSLS